MISSTPQLLCIGLLLALTVRLTAEEELICHQGRATFAPRDSSDHRKYAPSREIDILHLALDVTPDFKERTVAGKATLRFKPIAQPLQELKLDAVT